MKNPFADYLLGTAAESPSTSKFDLQSSNVAAGSWLWQFRELITQAFNLVSMRDLEPRQTSKQIKFPIFGVEVKASGVVCPEFLNLAREHTDYLTEVAREQIQQSPAESFDLSQFGFMKLMSGEMALDKKLGTLKVSLPLYWNRQTTKLEFSFHTVRPVIDTADEPTTSLANSMRHGDRVRDRQVWRKEETVLSIPAKIVKAETPLIQGQLKQGQKSETTLISSAKKTSPINDSHKSETCLVKPLPKVKLAIKKIDGMTVEIDIKKFPFSIGRQCSSDMSLDVDDYYDPSLSSQVSRDHLIIESYNAYTNTLSIVDKSKFGTFLNGIKCEVRFLHTPDATSILYLGGNSDKVGAIGISLSIER